MQERPLSFPLSFLECGAPAEAVLAGAVLGEWAGGVAGAARHRGAHREPWPSSTLITVPVTHSEAGEHR